MIALGGLAVAGYSQRQGRDGRALLASGAYIVGMLASTAFALFPTILPAVDPAQSLTIYNAASPRYGLVVGLVWWSLGMVLAAVYVVMIYRLFRGKVRLDELGYRVLLLPGYPYGYYSHAPVARPLCHGPRRA